MFLRHNIYNFQEILETASDSDVMWLYSLFKKKGLKLPKRCQSSEDVTFPLWCRKKKLTKSPIQKAKPAVSGKGKGKAVARCPGKSPGGLRAGPINVDDSDDSSGDPGPAPAHDNSAGAGPAPAFIKKNARPLPKKVDQQAARRSAPAGPSFDQVITTMETDLVAMQNDFRLYAEIKDGEINTMLVQELGERFKQVIDPDDRTLVSFDEFAEYRKHPELGKVFSRMMGGKILDDIQKPSSYLAPRDPINPVYNGQQVSRTSVDLRVTCALKTLEMYNHWNKEAPIDPEVLEDVYRRFCTSSQVCVYLKVREEELRLKEMIEKVRTYFDQDSLVINPTTVKEFEVVCDYLYDQEVRDHLDLEEYQGKLIALCKKSVHHMGWEIMDPSFRTVCETMNKWINRFPLPNKPITDDDLINIPEALREREDVVDELENMVDFEGTCAKEQEAEQNLKERMADKWPGIWKNYAPRYEIFDSAKVYADKLTTELEAVKEENKKLRAENEKLRTENQTLKASGNPAGVDVPAPGSPEDGPSDENDQEEGQGPVKRKKTLASKAGSKRALDGVVDEVQESQPTDPHREVVPAPRTFTKKRSEFAVPSLPPSARPSRQGSPGPEGSGRPSRNIRAPQILDPSAFGPRGGSQTPSRASSPKPRK